MGKKKFPTEAVWNILRAGPCAAGIKLATLLDDHRPRIH